MDLREFSQRLVCDRYEPAAVLVTGNLKCLQVSGPIDRYFYPELLRPSSDLISSAHPALRDKLHWALHEAISHDRRVLVFGAQLTPSSHPFSIDVQPTSFEGEKLLLVCLIDEQHLAPERAPPPHMDDAGVLTPTPPMSQGEPIFRDTDKTAGAVPAHNGYLFANNLLDITSIDEIARRTGVPLTERQRQILQRVLAGHPSKNIAADLGISRRTVENHRASIMRKTGARSIAELARMAHTNARRNED